MVADNKQLRKVIQAELVALIKVARAKLEQVEFTHEAIQQALNELLEETGQKPGTLFSIIRLAVSWAPFSPALPDTLALLGKESTLSRLSEAVASAE
jgi:glutamyl-tRNA synthetase